MAKTLGEVVEARAQVYRLADPDDNTSVGQAVAVSSGDAVAADSDSSHSVVGVRAEGAKQGDNIPVCMDGVVIASVASGLTAGAGVGAGAAASGNDGKLVSGGSRGVALSDEGGTYAGASLGTGEAAVLLF